MSQFFVGGRGSIFFIFVTISYVTIILGGVCPNLINVITFTVFWKSYLTINYVLIILYKTILKVYLFYFNLCLSCGFCLSELFISSLTCRILDLCFLFLYCLLDFPLHYVAGRWGQLLS